MVYKFFKEVKTVEELKKQYKQLAFKYHPDMGGKIEDMQAINAEYDELYKLVKNIHETAEGKTYTKKQEFETPDRFREIINAIITFNCRIEICGAWLWVFDAYAYRKELKELGFFWCAKKVAWAWTDEPSNNKHKLTMDEIRRLHGSEIIKEHEELKKIGAAI